MITTVVISIAVALVPVQKNSKTRTKSLAQPRQHAGEAVMEIHIDVADHTKRSQRYMATRLRASTI
ncbi:hypothetical protein E2C01_084244 [Portunus trituberculatus]|uniref:Uncharacterized protein n=1 Tax=Portunus trituberculatus TaxID=210409 RepID=A0A5B7JA70_PORTR|nr:hypothetical protein [Portunus trituberculatus]